MHIMATLGAILKTVNGLYIPPDGRVGFRAQELYESLSPVVLQEVFRFHRIERGIYALVPQNPAMSSYELRSRRVRRRIDIAKA
jgi:hypothetical protein